MSKEDAKKTIEFAIIDAFASTAARTGMNSEKAEPIVKKIMEELLDPKTRWAFKVLSEE